MSATETTTLPDYAPIPRPALGPALNEQGYYVGRVERNLYYVTDGTYMSAFLTTSDGVVVLDAPPTLGNNIQRAIDEIAAANGVSHKVNYLVYSHHHSDHVGAASLFDRKSRASGTRRRASSAAGRRSGEAERGDVPGQPHRDGGERIDPPSTAQTTRPTTSSSTCPTTTR
jgi:glyoxylase-like metal-dependent hydrolase (beta-lactamase superfamily II)